jgi:glycosyltransferase involved in cell wall biosynthesis
MQRERVGKDKGMILSGAYVARLDLGVAHHLGVTKKMAAQNAALQAAFGPVDHFAIDGLSVTRNEQVIWQQAPGRFARQRLHALGFYPGLAPYLQDHDYIYIRYQRCTPVFLHLLKTLRRQNPRRPIFVELPTYPYTAEQISRRDKILGFADRLTQGGMKGLVDRIVTFSDREEIFGIPTIRTENGVDLGAMPLLEPALDQGPLRLVAVANLGVRHAYDRVIAGLATYKGARPVSFEIIGSGSVEGALREQVAALGLQEQVTFAGPLSGAALNDRMSKAHIGIAALGMHRIAASTSDLKSREYCARGLPFVIANPDRDFGPDFPFAFHAPVDDSPLDIAALVAFHTEMRTTHSGFHTMMRAHAEAHLGWESKMRPVIEKIRAMVEAQA